MVFSYSFGVCFIFLCFLYKFNLFVRFLPFPRDAEKWAFIGFGVQNCGNSSSSFLTCLILSSPSKHSRGRWIGMSKPAQGQDCSSGSDVTGFYFAPKESSFHSWQQRKFSRQVLRLGCMFYIHLPVEESVTSKTEAAHSGFHILTAYCPSLALRLWTNQHAK